MADTHLESWKGHKKKKKDTGYVKNGFLLGIENEAEWWVKDFVTSICHVAYCICNSKQAWDL